LELIADILILISEVVFWVTVAAASAFVLRVILNWAGTNPFNRVAYTLTKITEPFVRPMRYGFSGRFSRFDLIPLVAALMILFAGFVIARVFGGVAVFIQSILGDSRLGLLTPRTFAASVILLLGLLYSSAILLRFFLPYLGVGYSNRFMRFLFYITEPLLKPLRRIRFLIIGPIDITPMVAVLLVQFAAQLIAGIVRGRL
jgi:uncharacterized protein YggT (Ycf19 family)